MRAKQNWFEPVIDCWLPESHYSFWYLTPSLLPGLVTGWGSATTFQWHFIGFRPSSSTKNEHFTLPLSTPIAAAAPFKRGHLRFYDCISPLISLSSDALCKGSLGGDEGENALALPKQDFCNEYIPHGDFKESSTVWRKEGVPQSMLWWKPVFCVLVGGHQVPMTHLSQKFS